MIVNGRVYSRSSAGRQTEVAGEEDVFKENPQRRWRIMEETGWESVFDGTLNLQVDGGVFEDLEKLNPLFFERPEAIKHPTNPRIPKMRGGYYYYRAMASVEGTTQEVLVRRAGNPHDKKCLELVAAVKLRERLRIDDGNDLEITVEGETA